MNNSLVEVRSIMNRLEQAFKCISKQRYSPNLYLFLSITIPLTYVFTLIPWGDEITVSLAILLGFCGSTSIVVFIGSLIIFVDEHIECSKRYFESIAKSVSITSEKELSIKFDERRMDYASMGVIELKYLPALLIVSYTSLLLIEKKMFSLALMLLFSAICGLAYHKVVELFAKHVEHETGLQELFIETYRVKDHGFKSFVKPSLVRIHVLLLISTLTLTVGLVAYSILRHKQVLNEHITIHRVNHPLIKDVIAKALGLIK